MFFKEKISETLGMPKDATMNYPRLILLGKSELTVENYKGVVEYTDKLLRLNTATHLLKIEGENLTISEMTSDDVEIRGIINKICME